MSTAHLAAGTVIAQDYRVVRPLAEGGMGVVYVAEQLSTGKERALKLLHPRLVADPRSRERFAREARAGAKIESEHVVEVVGAGVDAATGTPWLAMELLKGESLDAHVARRGPLPPADALAILRQVGHALAAAHRAGLVHRDLKPENVFLTTPQRDAADVVAKVVDFGVAKFVQEARGDTATDAIGSPFWMAPEQTDRRGRISPATDVWAFGLLAFHLLTAALYWRSAHDERGGIATFLGELYTEALDPPSARAAALGCAVTLPPGFDAWFARCVDRDAARRFPDAGAALAALVPVLRGEAPTAPAPTTAPTIEAPAVPRPVDLPPAPTAPPTTPVVAPTVAWHAAPAAPARRSRARLYAAAALALGAGALGVALLSPAPPPSVRATPTPPDAPAPPVAPAPSQQLAPAPVAVTADAGAPRAVRAPPRRASRPTASARATPANALGSLTVTATPWCDVAVDGVARGRTPLVGLPVRPGPHTVTCSNPGAGIARRSVTVPPDGQVRVALRPGA